MVVEEIGVLMEEKSGSSREVVFLTSHFTQLGNCSHDDKNRRYDATAVSAFQILVIPNTPN